MKVKCLQESLIYSRFNVKRLQRWIFKKNTTLLFLVNFEQKIHKRKLTGEKYNIYSIINVTRSLVKNIKRKKCLKTKVVHNN